MQSQERELIDGLFGKLKAYEAQPRDPEAERLIAGLVSAQPNAPYLLTQTVLVQEEALKAAQARIAELEAKAVAAPPPSFLGSAPKIGPWGAAPAQAQAPAAPGGAWQQQAAAQPAGGSFLRSALTTAAGVAGGALLFDGIRSLFGHSTDAFTTQHSQGFASGNFADDASSSLMPPDRMPPADLAQDDSDSSDYDTASSDSNFDSSDDV